MKTNISSVSPRDDPNWFAGLSAVPKKEDEGTFVCSQFRNDSVANFEYSYIVFTFVDVANYESRAIVAHLIRLSMYAGCPCVCVCVCATDKPYHRVNDM